MKKSFIFYNLHHDEKKDIHLDSLTLIEYLYSVNFSFLFHQLQLGGCHLEYLIYLLLP